MTVRLRTLETLALISVLLVTPTLQVPGRFKNVRVSPPLTNQRRHVAFSTAGGFEHFLEPTVAVSLKDPAVIVAGMGSGIVCYSSDGGKIWPKTKLHSKYTVGADSVLVSDVDGNFYFVHYARGQAVKKGDTWTNEDTWLESIVCQKSVDGGRTWDDGAQIGFEPPTDQDKPWATTHPNKPYVYVTWTRFDEYGSRDPKKFSNIMFSMSRDSGSTFSKAVRINELSGDCIDDDNTAEGAVPAVDHAGRIFVAWSCKGNIYVDRSFDEGKTWLDHDILIAKHPGGWAMDVPGMQRCNGQPVLMADCEKGRNRGNLYVVWADQRNGLNDTDIFFSRSLDHGTTWSEPLRVNGDPPGKHQFLPWMAVDRTTGNIYIVYYDRRAHNDDQTDVVLAYSTDGGRSFREQVISDLPFTPTTKGFVGDYTNISAHDGVIVPIWARMDDGFSTVWAAVILDKDLIRK